MSWEPKSKEFPCERASAKSEWWDSRAVYTSSTSEAGSRALPFSAHVCTWPRFFFGDTFPVKEVRVHHWSCIIRMPTQVHCHWATCGTHRQWESRWGKEKSESVIIISQGDCPSVLSLVRTHLECCVSCWPLTLRKPLEGRWASKGSRE